MADHESIQSDHNYHGEWLAALRAYLIVSVVAHFLWEIGHLPFYTLWAAGTFTGKAIAVFHCTAGDVIIAVVSLVGAIALIARRDWPAQRFLLVSALTLLFGIVYTIFSEWINLVVRKSWAYSDLMPTIPQLGTGLTPLLQWIVVPALALFAAKRAAKSKLD